MHTTTRRVDPAASQASGQRGSALQLTIHLVLLVLVLGQLVYLASRLRLRADLTSDRLWSLTQSTRDILARLDQRLLIEAYFSPKDKLPTQLRESRVVLDNFLDELVQLGKGKVVVQRFDPLADKAVADKCTRLGVKPIDMQTGTSSSISVDRHWQGLRLVYGGGKQKVLDQVGPQNSFLAEAILTPAIKEVATAQKRKFGFMEWPVQAAPGGQQAPSGIGWNLLRTHDAIAKRYEFQNFKDEEGALLPDDVDTLFLFRPKELTDRQKYVVDQFLMGGGTVVLFADAAEYQIGPRRSFTKVPFQLDAKDSQYKFLDQLQHYGIEWKPRILADLRMEAMRSNQPQEYFGVPQRTPWGQTVGQVFYPYFFHAVGGDWSKLADELATRNGHRDEDLAERYRRFRPGIDSEEFLFQAFKKIGRGPGFYWPTWVDLRRKPGAPDAVDLPVGITGKVMLWSSPEVLTEEPPQSLDPIGQGDGMAQTQQLTQFRNKLLERLSSEPRQQAPLMVEVQGEFPSFFAGKERPKRPAEIKEEEAKKAAAAAKAAADDGKPDEGKPDPNQPPAADPLAKTDPVGPPAPKTEDEADAAAQPVAPEAPQRERAVKPGRILAIGDADFVRDDLVRQDYAQSGGPVSVNGGGFFSMLLDWLAQDRELVELQSRVPTDRTLTLVQPSTATRQDPRVEEQKLRTTTQLLLAANIVLPCLLLIAFGFLVFLWRNAQKRAFLHSVQAD